MLRTVKVVLRSALVSGRSPILVNYAPSANVLMTVHIQMNKITCAYCKESLPEDAFCVRRDRASGKSSYCRKCKSVQYRKRRAGLKSHLEQKRVLEIRAVSAWMDAAAIFAALYRESHG